MTRTLLVPLIRPEEDPDGASEAVLPTAMALAARLDANVVLVSVLGLPAEATEDGGQRLLHASDAFPDDERLLPVKQLALQTVADLEAYLSRMAEQFPAGKVATLVRYGDARIELPNVARQLDEPLIIMASHARRGLQRLMVGSVAFSVVSDADCPVIIVPVGMRSPVEFRRVLVPLDGSLLAEYALDAGLAMLGPQPLEIHLVQVIEPVTIRAGIIVDDYYGAAREEARQYLEGVSQRLTAAGHEVQWTVQLGTPADEIGIATERVEPNLIVMATHGRSGLRRVVLGSVAERVLHTTQRPLLLLRPTEEELQAQATISSATTTS